MVSENILEIGRILKQEYWEAKKSLENATRQYEQAKSALDKFNADLKVLEAAEKKED